MKNGGSFHSYGDVYQRVRSWLTTPKVSPTTVAPARCIWALRQAVCDEVKEALHQDDPWLSRSVLTWFNHVKKNIEWLLTNGDRLNGDLNSDLA